MIVLLYVLGNQPMLTSYRYLPGVVPLPSWRRTATNLALYCYQPGSVPPLSFPRIIILYMVYLLSPFPPSFVFFSFLTPSFPAICAFSSKKLPKKFPVSFAFAVIRPTFAPAFGKEPSGSPGARKKKSPEIWRICPEVVTFASAFPFLGMHLVKDSSLKRFHKRSKQYKSRAFLARRIWQPSAARPLREACGGEPSKRERRPAQDRKDARPLRGLGSRYIITMESLILAQDER